MPSAQQQQGDALRRRRRRAHVLLLLAAPPLSDAALPDGSSATSARIGPVEGVGRRHWAR